MKKPSETKTVFSGVQPSGALHLGNYLGAISQFVDLQENHDCLYCIVDLHAITVYQKPEDLRQNVLEVAAAYLASGVDPDQSVIFQQSRVGAHAELAWILNCIARVGWLARMPQYKDKTQNQGENSEGPSVGLFDYPVLQAADILLYDTDLVPVGSDQIHHLELARDIAQKFNNDYGSGVFKLPQAMLTDTGARVMSLIDGTAKMSKSDPSDPSRINLQDSNDVIAKKIKRATSDSALLPDNLDDMVGRHEALNLLGIFAACERITLPEALSMFAGKGFGALKPALADAVVARVAPVRDEMSRLLQDPNHLNAILDRGAVSASTRAQHSLSLTKTVMGLSPTNS